MKMAPILRAIKSHPKSEDVHVTLIHTGQHYDANLSDVFFRELGMPRPDVTLEVGSGSHAVQTARVLEKMETVLKAGASGGNGFDRLIVVGDVNSTMAASLAAAKLGIPIAHVEAGLRSFDRTMPEEINRIVTDSISDMLLVSEPAGLANLLREGHARDSISLVGNVMIDTLLSLLPKAKALQSFKSYGFSDRGYGVVTLHRPSNVDDVSILGRICDVLIDTASRLPLIFPVHPRTREMFGRAGLQSRLESARHLHIVEPLGYLEFLSLNANAQLIVTDSGGVQEESTVLGVPCLTLRPNTERPITVESGTSTLIGNDFDLLRDRITAVLEGRYKTGSCPDIWDGHASKRIAAELLKQ